MTCGVGEQLQHADLTIHEFGIWVRLQNCLRLAECRLSTSGGRAGELLHRLIEGGVAVVPSSAMERRYWMGVLLLTLTLVLLFVLGSVQHWQPHRWNLNSPAQAPDSQAALAFLRHHRAQLLAHLNNSTLDPHTEFVQHEIKVNEHLQILLSSSTSAAAKAPACPSTADDPPLVPRGAVGIPWRPQGGRYLVLICDSGQVTNHLICLHKHMYMAALLNRTLVLPPSSLDYKYEHLLDMAHLRRCFGNSSILTCEAFEQVRGKNLHIDKLVCFMPDCYFDRDHQTKWEAQGFTFGPRQDAWSSETPQPRRHDAVLAGFVREEAVIAVGDLFYAKFKDAVDFAVTHPCSTLAWPHPSIVVAAQRFVQTYLGSNFVAVHFRRHGFLVFCNKQTTGPSCFYPVPQAARCIERKVREVGADVVFLSTDAAASEVEALVAVLQQSGVVVVRRSATHEALAKWDAVLWRQAGREAEAGVMAMVDKTICSLAVAFVGTRGSSFSAHIQSMRLAMATASSCDAPLCHGQGPSFIAPVP